MGSSLSSRGQFDSSGRLDFSQRNRALLEDVVKYVQTLNEEHPRESTVVFERPFQWETRLSTDAFKGLPAKAGLTIAAGEVQSTAKTSNGDALLSLSVTGKRSEIRCWTFERLGQVLQCAGEKRLTEVQACLEANTDPMSNIMGPAFSAMATSGMGAGSALLATHERLSRERARGGTGEDSGGVEQLDNSFRLLILLSSLDVQLLQKSLHTLGKEVRVGPEVVQREVELLSCYVGKDYSTKCLESLDYTSDFIFANGCRAPPWRQVHGDVCCLFAKPLDGHMLCITANTAGYYVNKGPQQDGEINYEQDSDVYPTLVALLKDKSRHFAEKITQQEFAEQPANLPVQRSGKEEKPPADSSERQKESEQAVRPEAGRSARNGRFPSAKKTTSSLQVKPTTSDRRASRKESRSTGGMGTMHPVLGDTFDPNSDRPSAKWEALGLETTSSQFSVSMERRQTSPQSHPSDNRQFTRTVDQEGRATSSFSLDNRESEESSEEEEEDEQQDMRQDSGRELPADYWAITKLIKYLKGGNPAATIIALCCLRTHNLSQEACQLALRDNGGLELLINLLETTDLKCKIGSLLILKEISRNTQIRRQIADLGGLLPTVPILRSKNRQLRSLAAETIANVAQFQRARRSIRHQGGIKWLVALLEVESGGLPKEEEEFEVVRAGALALWSCSKSRANKVAIRRAGAVPKLANLLKTDNESLLIPVVGTLQECASDPVHREMIRTEGMVEDLVRHLSNTNSELQRHSASAIFKCAEEEATRNLVRQYGGLKPLVKLLQEVNNKPLLAAATGAIWKCTLSRENVKQLRELKVVELLVGLLMDQPEEVLVNVAGAISECAKETDNRVTLRKSGGIPPLIDLLTGTNQPLLINVTHALCQCALEAENMLIIDKQDGVRLLWSLLKSPNPEVVSSAAWAICPCIERAKDAGELVRSFVGGLELIVGLLRSDNQEVLASVCAAIANIASDEENLAVITDHGVVPLLARLTVTDNDALRKHLAEAIARCCAWGNNREAFGTNFAVAPIVRYLRSPDPLVHRATARALHQLSKRAENCITMHKEGVVKHLIRMMGSSDEILQEAAASCVSNIRRLALANEKARMVIAG